MKNLVSGVVLLSIAHLILVFNHVVSANDKNSPSDIDVEFQKNLPLLIFQRFQQMRQIINGQINEIERGNKSKEAKRAIFQLHDIITTDILAMKSFQDEIASRKNDLSKFSQKIQKRINRLQFPTNCEKVKKLVCVIWPSGFGYQFFQLNYCFSLAFHTNRVTLPMFIRYPADQHDDRSYDISWKDLFLPISNCSTTMQMVPSFGDNQTNNENIVYVYNFNKLSDVKVPILPKNFEKTLSLHPYPPLFFVSQFVNFTMRYTKNFHKELENRINAMKFWSPMVGIHVRRTDKLEKEEALKYELEDYMKHVDDWYNFYELKNTSEIQKRRVLLVTDDPQVIDEALKKYPNYEFFYDYQSSVRAKKLSQVGNLKDIVFSVHLLSRCDFIVCTLSSFVCRLAYEMMEGATDGDLLEDKIKSLDVPYHHVSLVDIVSKDDGLIKYSTEINQVGLFRHEKSTVGIRDEIDVDVGDILFPRHEDTKIKNYFDGYAFGVNNRTGKRGFYPRYKVRYNW